MQKGFRKGSEDQYKFIVGLQRPIKDQNPLHNCRIEGKKKRKNYCTNSEWVKWLMQMISRTGYYYLFIYLSIYKVQGVHPFVIT